MNVPPVHVIATDDVAEKPTFEATARELIAAGRERVALHLRLRRPSARVLYELARRISDLADASGAWCVVNGRLDVALASGAHGVQLGHGALPVQAARDLGGRLAIGASVHSAAEATVAARAGAHYLVAGSVFSTATHPDADPAGTALVTSCAEAGVPVLGIGGIDVGNAGLVIEAGATGVAVVRAVWAASDPVRALLGLLERVSPGASSGAAGGSSSSGDR